MLREIPSFDRPREKAIKYGIESLSNVELLAILLRTGTKNENVMEVSKKILYNCENLSALKDMNYLELMEINGIGSTKAITLMACIELGLRIINEKNEITVYNNPKEIFNHFFPKLKNKSKEYLYALFLNAKGMLIKEQLITQGTISSSILDGKDIIKWALRLSASAVILVHNHPSGDSMPSLADLKATSNFIKQARNMDIEVIDHIIIGNNYYSMKENNSIYKMF